MPLRIFVTTDNHVGYNELDQVRGDDAARSFDEAMSIAQSENVDLVIQGGDLFHVNKPSKRALYSVMKTLRRTCLSDKPVELQVLNHGPLSLDDDEEFDHPNFEDPNFNVGIPVFAISGNHDDAGGSGTNNLISPLDVLGMSGLINHFGRIHDATNIVVTPILIEKAGIRLALYGMASVRDERLYRTFRDNKVKFLRPREEPDSWYSILVVHQNHTQHGPTNFLPEQFLPNFIDLVIWGHEHECLIEPTLNMNKGFQVMQPGSTVATSLSESEIKPKHVAILTISPNRLMSCETFRLTTVRPFAMKTVSLALDAPHIKANGREARAKVTEWLMGQVELLIEEAYNGLHSRDTESSTPPSISMLPLVRLRVDYSGGYEVENTTRFSNRFINRVANSNDILHLIKKRQTAGSRILPKSVSSDGPLSDNNADNAQQVGQLVHEFLASEQLQILLERGMDEALSKFVEKDEKLALKIGVDKLVQDQVDKLLDPVQGLTLEAASIYTPQEQLNEAEPGPRKESRKTAAPKQRSKATAQADRGSSSSTTSKSNTQKSALITRGARKRGTTASVQEEPERQPMEIEESDPEMEPSAGTFVQDNSRPEHRERAVRARSRAAIAIQPLEDDFSDIGDDSDEMFSPGE